MGILWAHTGAIGVCSVKLFPLGLNTVAATAVWGHKTRRAIIQSITVPGELILCWSRQQPSTSLEPAVTWEVWYDQGL